MASVTFSGGFTYCGLIILCLLIVLSVDEVNCSATCVEKFLDGDTAEKKHEVFEGERVTLRCDVSARDPAKDMVYWKFDDEVMSQDATVIPKYQSKFNVTLEDNFNGSGKDVYTITWIAELDDAGKYNCTCTTGGIQFPVWIKRACNERKHVIKTTDPSKLNSTTSQDVLNFLLTNTSYKLEVDQSLNVSISLDCNCTWPEVNRTLMAVWITENTEDRCYKGCNPVEEVPNNVIGKQDTSITPIGCYTGKGSVTYRYRNVFLGIKDAVFTCTMAMLGKEYSLYIEEGQSTRSSPFMKISCSDGVDTVCSATCYVCIITGSIAFVCLIGMIAMIVIQRTMRCKALQPGSDQLPTDQRQATTVVKKLDLLNLGAKIVYGIIIAVGVGSFIALLVQTIDDSKCKIPWSRKYSCAKCECYLQGADIVAPTFVAILIVGVTTATIVFFAKSFAPVKPKENNPKGSSQSSSRRVSHNQVYPNVEGEENPKVVNQNETDTDTTPRRKKHSPLRERIPNRVSPAPSGDDCEKQSEPQWDDKERTFANGGHVPVSGSSSGQLSNMTPEKHPRPRLDPIITVPEGGDPPAGENGESPRKRKKRKHKKRRHHRSSPDGENITDQSPEHCDANINPGYVDNETKPTNDASF